MPVRRFAKALSAQAWPKMISVITHLTKTGVHAISNVCRIPTNPWAAPRYFLSCHSYISGELDLWERDNERPDSMIRSHTCDHTRTYKLLDKSLTSQNRVQTRLLAKKPTGFYWVNRPIKPTHPNLAYWPSWLKVMAVNGASHPANLSCLLALLGLTLTSSKCPKRMSSEHPYNGHKSRQNIIIILLLLFLLQLALIREQRQCTVLQEY